MSAKLRFALFGSLAALGVLVAAFLLPSRSARYIASARVMVMPYTNAIFAPSFEAGVVQCSQGVLRLQIFPSLSPKPMPTSPTFTNGACIDIVVSGASSLEAQQLANNAAVALCANVRQLYGGNALVVDMANRARPYSTFHDAFMPRVAKVFARWCCTECLASYGAEQTGRNEPRGHVGVSFRKSMARGRRCGTLAIVAYAKAFTLVLARHWLWGHCLRVACATEPLPRSGSYDSNQSFAELRRAGVLRFQSTRSRTRSATCRTSTIPPLDGRHLRTYVFDMREPQNDTTPGSGDTGLLSLFAWALFLSLVAYPLSVAPAAKLIGPNPPASVRAIYSPLGYLHAHSQPVRSFYDWYAKLWGVRL
jgi:hypothetical protein